MRIYLKKKFFCAYNNNNNKEITFKRTLSELVSGLCNIFRPRENEAVPNF